MASDAKISDSPESRFGLNPRVVAVGFLLDLVIVTVVLAFMPGFHPPVPLRRG